MCWWSRFFAAERWPADNEADIIAAEEGNASWKSRGPDFQKFKSSRLKVEGLRVQKRMPGTVRLF
jgi:hypothetical protein